MKRLLLALLLAVTAILASSLAAGEWLTQPSRATLGPAPAGLSAVTVRVPYGDGQQVTGWFLPGRPHHGALLLLHGVHGNRLQMLERARWLQRQGMASLLIDLPAHGDSSGERITFGRREAAAVGATLGWLRERLPGERLGAIGVSLGGASLLFAQRQPELDALVLESVYPTIEEAVRNRLTARLGPIGAPLAPLLLLQLPLRLGLHSHDLRPIDAMAQLQAPVLIAAGTADLSTPWPETERLSAAAHVPKALWPVPQAGHVDLYDFNPEAYQARLGPWLHERLRTPPG